MREGFRKAERSRNVELREGSGIATAKGQTEFAATASPRRPGEARDRESSVVRSNFIEHRVQSDVKRVRMEARSNIPSAKTTPQPSLDNDEPPHGRRGRKSTLRAGPSPREKPAKAAAIFSSTLGNGKAYGYVAIDAYIQRDPAEAARYRGAYMNHPSYRWVIAWIVLSSVFWVLIGNPDFIGFDTHHQRRPDVADSPDRGCRVDRHDAR